MEKIEILWLAAGCLVVMLGWLFMTLGGGLKHFNDYDK